MSSTNFFHQLDRKRQPRPQLIFIIGPQHSGAGELCKKIKERFQTLDSINTTTNTDTGSIIDALFPYTTSSGNQTLLRPALLERFPRDAAQWGRFKDGSKVDGKRVWVPTQSLVVKVVSDVPAALDRWERATPGEKSMQARNDARKRYVAEEKATQDVYVNMGGTRIHAREVKGSDIDEVLKMVGDLL
ncbi:hypothetical protein BDW02DRAFT_596795 [Decorospora gaudefroyi]|uniref:Adenylate kinase n=1 Tax=Decorospora gaudefroyi TaxID=184978 RepID=A0A6A5KD85_9PLEO|nr:hypothetical protein BDW02DRAFT_596795 [Decorospora gaudefroyi]